MGTLDHDLTENSTTAVHSRNEEHHEVAGVASQTQSNEKELDAGALFVLKSEGSWLHAGYHLTTSIVAPPLLSLPLAFASLGWIVGICFLVVGFLFIQSNLYGSRTQC